MNDTKFFNRIRSTLYGGSLRQITVDNINVILRFWESNYPNNINTQLAYVLATVLAEVGINMSPVRETFATSDAQARQRLKRAGKRYAESVPPHGHAYYGRGYVQLTWKFNYAAQEQKLGIPLVEFPDLALKTENAVQILVNGMMAGDFNGRGHGLPHYLNENRTDFVNARRTVNILDRANEIAGYAESFLDAIEYADEPEPSVSNSSEEGSNLSMRPSLEHMVSQHTSSSTTRFGQITASTLNLRAESNTSSTILGSFPTGTIVEILDTVTGGSYSLPSGRTSREWDKVIVEEKEGFLAAEFIADTGSPTGTSRVLNAIYKVNAEHPYYKARDITGDQISETFCNWFAADVLDQLNIQLPRLDETAGSYVEPHPIYGNNTPFKPYAAESLLKFFEREDSRSSGKWQLVSSDTADKASAQAAAVRVANKDKVVVASYGGGPGQQGHIAIVRPDSLETNLRVAQAGRISRNNLSLADAMGSVLNKTKFFTFTD